ncbi:N-acetylglucosaminyl deacetylase, LmbE family [Streptomyces sp. 1222.5]|uniref:PIG-L deacetylase family protein n=1 Tax=unclassified Streptomyces TaxID=2593676 RepID=UPI00089D277D|nr:MULTISPECIES: PIG-L deacetylase family protein [unclassified Streptomyces]PKW11967.1 LmbE family N-acetylglucosaminyl deacetylase [Streptomyces sp. 5112.2]SEB65705.1 N-acetylglucosaminyl deacetylase, LmbE family [Streptomyces sp. 1222.5]SEE26716.1 N-acetylglucosaminyl deacetylase, LmbE family [Streptomyces sp. 2231.1]
MSDEFQEMPEDWTRALAVVAHPDDMEFGAAGAVARWTAAGKTVTYVVASRGEAGIDTMAPEKAAEIREAEQRASAAVVGAAGVEFLDHPDGRIEYSPELRRQFATAIRRHRPELVLGFCHHDHTSTGRWNSPDHRNTGRALLDAVGDAANRWIFPEDGPGPWQGVRYVAISNSPRPTHAVDVGEHIDRAVASLEAHASYLAAMQPPVTDVRGPLLGLAQAMGARFGGRPAIAFELIPR